MPYLTLQHSVTLDQFYHVNKQWDEYTDTGTLYEVVIDGVTYEVSYDDGFISNTLKDQDLIDLYKHISDTATDPTTDYTEAYKERMDKDRTLDYKPQHSGNPRKRRDYYEGNGQRNVGEKDVPI